MAQREPIRKQCITSPPGVNNNPWGIPINHTVTLSTSDTQLIKVNEIVLNMVFGFNGITAGTPVSITVPGTGFFTQVGTTVEMFAAGNTFKTIVQQSTPGRGNVAYMQQLVEYSASNFQNNQRIELLGPFPVVTSMSGFEVRIPFKFLHDFAEIEDKLMPIHNIAFNASFLPLLNVFQPPFLQSSTFGVQLNQLEYYYTMYDVAGDTSMIRSLEDLVPSNIRMGAVETPIVGTVYNANVPCIGIPIKVFFYLLTQTASAFDGSSVGIYNLNQTDAAIVTSIQLQAGNVNFPTTAAYNSIKTPTLQTNINRHYTEFQIGARNFDNNSNSILSFDNWLNNYRIYCVTLSGLIANSNIQSIIKLGASIPAAPVTNIVFAIIFIDTTMMV
jgi:hypothetical protein